MFFCSDIQATDSTHTGCRAKARAASRAPGTASRRSTKEKEEGDRRVQENIQEVEASRGMFPQIRYSAQNAVCRKG